MSRMLDLAVQHANLSAALKAAREEYANAVNNLDTTGKPDLHPFATATAYTEVWQAEIDLEAFEQQYKESLNGYK